MLNASAQPFGSTLRRRCGPLNATLKALLLLLAADVDADVEAAVNGGAVVDHGFADTAVAAVALPVAAIDPKAGTMELLRDLLSAVSFFSFTEAPRFS